MFPYVSGRFMYSRGQGWDRELGSQIAGGGGALPECPAINVDFLLKEPSEGF